MSALQHSTAAQVRPVGAHAAPAPPPACEERAPSPRYAKAGDELVLAWRAGPRPCDSAEVVLRTHGRKLLVWLYEAPRTGEHLAVLAMRHRNVFTLPVSPKDGMVTLKVPWHEKPGVIPTDGRTGRRIPSPAT
ncbi:hypothetical protein ACFQYP_39735 [Nonomuraea antimicrobica]